MCVCVCLCVCVCVCVFACVWPLPELQAVAQNHYEAVCVCVCLLVCAKSVVSNMHSLWMSLSVAYSHCLACNYQPLLSCSGYEYELVM